MLKIFLIPMIFYGGYVYNAEYTQAITLHELHVAERGQEIHHSKSVYKIGVDVPVKHSKHSSVRSTPLGIDANVLAEMGATDAEIKTAQKALKEVLR